MLAFLPAPVRGAIASLLLALNTLFWCALLFALALLKLLVAFAPARAVLDPWLNRVATAWIACNGAWMRLTQTTAWDVEGVARIRRDAWYLVIANHQSWVDVFVLQRIFNRRIPLLKFFLKRQLIFVPVIGLAWWALDFPFMRRHSRAALARRPELRERDRETTRRACARFSRIPTSVMSFAEGTRFSEAKRRSQHSPFRHLLKPRTGALALSLNAMGERFSALIDVTIVYPGGAPSFWRFACGRVPRIVVRARQLPIPPEFCTGDYAGDHAFRERFNAWMMAMWARKDREIDALLQAPSRAAA